MKLSKYALAQIFDAADDFDNANALAALALKALDDGTLEIEGYVRADHFADDSKKVSWTKFDPNDPKTFPPKDEHIYITNLYAGHDERWACKLDEYYLELVVNKLSSAVKDHGAVIYWRPLPKPPVETGVGKTR